MQETVSSTFVNTIKFSWAYSWRFILYVLISFSIIGIIIEIALMALTGEPQFIGEFLREPQFISKFLLEKLNPTNSITLYLSMALMEGFLAAIFSPLSYLAFKKACNLRYNGFVVTFLSPKGQNNLKEQIKKLWWAIYYRSALLMALLLPVPFLFLSNYLIPSWGPYYDHAITFIVPSGVIYYFFKNKKEEYKFYLAPMTRKA